MLLAYVDHGAGPVVVLLHGFPLSRVMWAEQVDVIGSAYRVIAPDLRGQGESPAPEGIYSMDEMADDVVELLEGLEVNQPIVLGGLSMGGYVALSLALRYRTRLRGLMLIDTRAVADTPEAAKNREETATAVLETGNPSTLIKTMIPRLFGKTTLEHHPERIQPMLTIMEKTSAVGIAGALRGMAVRPDRRGDLAGITVPTLVLVGEEDVISPPDEARGIAQSLPNARLEVIPKAGHLAPYENPAAVNSAIVSFLQGLD
jgi:3-oxoadipate enol-lactonase